MPRVTRVVELPLPDQELFERLVDWSWHALWQPSLVEAQSPRPLVVGSRVRELRQAFGQRAEAEFEVTALEPPRLVRAAAVSGPLMGVQEYIVEADPAGSRLTVAFEVELPLVLRMLEAMVEPAMSREADESIANLRALLTDGRPPGGFDPPPSG